MGDPLHDFYSVEQAAELVGQRPGPALEVLGDEDVEFVAIHPADTDAGREQIERVARALDPEAFATGWDWDNRRERRELAKEDARFAVEALKEG